MSTVTRTNSALSEATAPVVSATTVQHLDPRALLLDRNIRTEPRLDPAFLDSIRQHGILVPISAETTPDGEVRVVHGHRRTQAAIAAGHATVPVLVEAQHDDTTAGEIRRIITQHAENTRRAGLTTAEHTDTVAQLALLGVSPAQTVKRTGSARAAVDAGLTVSRSPVATQAVNEHGLDLTHAAVLAEFDDDPDIVAALLAAVPDGLFDHQAQRARDARRDAAERGEHRDTLVSEGVTVLNEDEAATRLHRLTHDGDQLTDDTHRHCPGHAAVVEHGWVHSDDTATGWRPPDRQVRTVWVCTDPTAHGHTDRWAPGPGQRPAAADMSPEQAEDARTERRDVRESNTAWRSAVTVRTDFARTLCSRKTPPTGAATFVAAALAHDAVILSHYRRHAVTADLLGLPEHSGPDRISETITRASAPRAHVLALAHVLGAYEAASSLNDWRQQQPPTVRYLHFLAACGYTLSPVEHRACGHTPDDHDGEGT